MRVIGQEAIAAVFGVAPKTIVEWQGAGFPVAQRGGPGVPSEYETEPCINWLVDRERAKVQGESPRDRVFRLQGDQIEREMAKDGGLLIHVDTVEPKWRAAVLAAREFLMRSPAPLAAKTEGLDRKQRESLLREAFEGFLRRLSAWHTDHHLDEDTPSP